MNSLNVWITSKVPVVKGQNSPDAMNSHCGGQPRIVDLNAGNTICDKQSPPLVVHG